MSASERWTIRSERGRRRRRGLRTLVVSVLVLGALLWSGYWYAAYRIAVSTVDAADAGAALRCDEHSLGGFPFHLTFACRQAEAATGPVVTASIAGLDASAPLYSPGHVAAAMTGPFRLDLGGVVADADWRGGEASVDAGLSGVSGAAAAFQDLKLAFRDQSGEALLSVEAGHWSGDFRSVPDEADAFRLDLSTEDMVLAGGGSALPRLSAAGTLTLLGVGPSLGSDVERMMAAWLAAGGRFRVDAFTFASAGVTVEMAGPLSLEDDGSFSGDMTVRFTGPEALPALIAGFLPRWQGRADEIAAAILMLSTPVPERPQTVETRLSLKRGVVSVGFIPVFTLPPLGGFAAATL